MRHVFPACLSLLLLSLASPAPAQAAGDLESLQGTWKTTSGRAPELSLILTIKDDTVKLAFTVPGGETTTLDGKLKLDDQASPKTIDWIEFKRPDGSPAAANLGIYKLEGNKLTVLNGGPDGSRPTEFPAIELGVSNYFMFEKQ